MLVNPLNILGDHQLDAGGKLRVWRLLATRSFSTPLAAHRRDKSTLLHVRALDRQLIAALQAGVWKFTEGLIKEEANVSRRDFVSRNIIPQLGVIHRVLGVPWQIFTGQLPPDQLWIFRKKKDAAGELHRRRTLADFALEQKVGHT